MLQNKLLIVLLLISIILVANGQQGFIGFIIGSTATVYAEPTTRSSAIGRIPIRTQVYLECQVYGESVARQRNPRGTSRIWDYLPAYGGYVSDVYVNTGSKGFVTDRCSF